MKQVGSTLVLETLDEIDYPGHTALLQIDIQNDNVSPCGLLASRGVDISAVRRTIKHGAVFLAVIGAAAAVDVLAQRVADNYPNKPVRLVVGSSPGGGTDITARIVAEKLAESWGNPIIVENRSSGAIYGLEATARASPDGYTLGLAASTGYVQAVLKIKLPFSLKNDLAPVIQLTSQPYLLVVPPSLPASSVKELIALAKVKPGALNYGSTGIGSEAHVGMEIFSSMAGISMTHVPYKGAGPALTDLMGGQIQLLFPSAISGVPHVRSGKLKALAVTTDKRAKLLPDLPTISESGVPGFELRGWYGLVAPAGIAPATLQKIHRGVADVLGRSDIQAKFAAAGAETVASNSPAVFRDFVAREIDKLEKFGKSSGLRLE